MERYELIDFGDGRKLERVAGRLIDRPSPAADRFARERPTAWKAAGSRFDPFEKRWHHRGTWASDAAVDCGGFCMPVSPTPAGHIGVFPEQALNWDWLRTFGLPTGLSTVPEDAADRPLGLNLFGYTGASTMAMVSAGLAVAHVDAAKPNVQSARAAAKMNGWSTPPIRFLVDDAVKFAAREIRRGRRYHTIVMDPPAYGHGPGGKAWRLERDVWPLIDDCLKLLTPESFRLLVTGHSPDVDEHDVREHVQRSIDRISGPSGQVRYESGRSGLSDESGRTLDAGFYVRIWNVN